MNIDIGRAGDFIAAAALSRMGVQNVISNQAGFDLVAFVPQPMRIEVKTASKTTLDQKNVFRFQTSRGSKRKIMLNSQAADVVCLVSLTHRCCVFLPIEEITSPTTRIPVSHFTPREETSSWLKTLNYFKEK